MVKEEDFPYIVSVFDIEALTEMVDERELIMFIAERTEMSKRGRIIAFDEPDYLRFYLKPEFKLIKAMLSQDNSIFNYVGSPELPVRKPELLMDIFDQIGSESFAIFDLTGSIGRRAKVAVMEILYSVYCDWAAAGDHLVHSMIDFESLVKDHLRDGKPCKVVAWGGFREYIRNSKKPDDVLRQVGKLAVSYGLNVLLVYSYEHGLENILNEEQKRHENDVKRFLRRRQLLAVGDEVPRS